MCGDITKGWTGLQAQHDFDEESEILGSSQHPFVRTVKIPTDLRAINISVYNETFLAQIEFQGKHKTASTFQTGGKASEYPSTSFKLKANEIIDFIEQKINIVDTRETTDFSRGHIINSIKH